MEEHVTSIGFGAHEPWETPIRYNLAPRYSAEFLDLTTPLERFDAVVPLRSRQCAVLRLQPHLYGRKFVHPGEEQVALCRDKLALNRFLMGAGFADFVPSLRDPGPPYPYIRKARTGGWGVGCKIIFGPDDEVGLDLADPDFFCQDVVPGETEHCTHILRVGGRVRYVLTITYVMRGPATVKGEFNTPAELVARHGCEHIRLFARILDHIGYEGIGCFDYKVADGHPWIFELNPRFGASLGYDVSGLLDAYLAALAPPD